MLIILKEGDGDYEDYREYVIAVLDVETDKTIDVLNKEHQEFLIQLMTEHNIPIYPNQPWALKGVVKKAIKTEHRRLYDQNDFLNWIKNAYPYKQITNFVEQLT